MLFIGSLVLVCWSRDTTKGTQGLGLTGRFVYVQVRRTHDDLCHS